MIINKQKNTTKSVFDGQRYMSKQWNTDTWTEECNSQCKDDSI